MVTISEMPIDPATTYQQLEKRCSGSIVFHYASVKEQNNPEKKTTGIEYKSADDTEAELMEIAKDLKNRWKLEDVLLTRRIGKLGIGDIISLVAASSPNSEDAFEACKYGISCMKKMTTIQKNEMYA